MTTINVNGRPRKWTKDVITYDEVDELAQPNHVRDPHRIVTVVWKGHERTGSLAPGTSIAVEDGMHFTVVVTGRA